MRGLSPCCICGSSEHTVRYEATSRTESGLPASGPYAGHYRINTCRGCGLLFSSPIFDETEVNTLYTGYSEANVADSEIANVKATMRGYYDLGRRFLAGKKSALDIGCDIGLMLEVLQEDGFVTLCGIEPVAVARTRASERVPTAEISDVFYEQSGFRENEFDLVTLVHVVDHLVRPDRVLDGVLRDLRPGGICIAVVHDVESPLARLMGESFPVFNYFHHYFFSKRTLRALFEARGFDVLCVVATRNRYSLAFFIERVPFLPQLFRLRLAHLSRRLAVGHIPISIPVGNIGIVARKPAPAGG
jgi:SAM-dependent methyltransferase